MARGKIGKDVVLSLYPDALTATYCVPPIHFNRVAYVRDTVADQPVLILQGTSGTADVSSQHVSSLSGGADVSSQSGEADVSSQSGGTDVSSQHVSSQSGGADVSSQHVSSQSGTADVSSQHVSSQSGTADVSSQSGTADVFSKSAPAAFSQPASGAYTTAAAGPGLTAAAAVIQPASTGPCHAATSTGPTVTTSCHTAELAFEAHISSTSHEPTAVWAGPTSTSFCPTPAEAHTDSSSNSCLPAASSISSTATTSCHITKSAEAHSASISHGPTATTPSHTPAEAHIDSSSISHRPAAASSSPAVTTSCHTTEVSDAHTASTSYAPTASWTGPTAPTICPTPAEAHADSSSTSHGPSASSTGPFATTSRHTVAAANTDSSSTSHSLTVSSSTSTTAAAAACRVAACTAHTHTASSSHSTSCAEPLETVSRSSAETCDTAMREVKNAESRVTVSGSSVETCDDTPLSAKKFESRETVSGSSTTKPCDTVPLSGCGKAATHSTSSHTTGLANMPGTTRHVASRGRSESDTSRNAHTCSQAAETGHDTATSCRESKLNAVQRSHNPARGRKGKKKSRATEDYTASSSGSSAKTGQQRPGGAPYSMWTEESPQHASSRPSFAQCNTVQEDFAQNHVLVNLQELGRHRREPMFILSQFSFDDYLKRSARLPGGKELPRSSDLEIPYRRGDFDVLIIHRHYGILVGELKSVGWYEAAVSRSQAESDADVARRLEKAVVQLEKSERVMRHLLSDVVQTLTVRKTLILSYVSRARLLDVLLMHPDLGSKVRQCMGATSTEDAIQLCCCSDELSDPVTFWHVKPDVLQRLTSWWQRRMTCTAADPMLDDELYLEIVGRFVGPASSVSIHCVVPPRVEVRTDGEAVSELGRRLARLVLTPRQLDLTRRAPPRVCITGPPGVGKTVMLILMGLKWLLEGQDVHVISTRPASLAASQVMYYQLSMTAKAYRSSEPRPKRIAASSYAGSGAAAGGAAAVHLHRFDFYKEGDVDEAIRDLSAAAKDGQLHVLMEEAVFSDRGSVLGPRYLKLIHSLLSNVPELCLWVARVRHDNIPDVLSTETLARPLRSAPVVLREVRPGVEKHNVFNYSDDQGVAAPGDGPRVVRLLHGGGGSGGGDDGDGGHSGVWPHQCRRCGREVARVLLRQLNVGSGTGQRRKPISTNSPDPLRFSDVFVLTRSSDLQDDVNDDANTVTSPASGVVLGLRDAGVPVCVLEYSPGSGSNDRARWERDVVDTAVAGTDRVTVAHWRPVLGLERKVVVWLRGRTEGDDDDRSEEEVEAWDRVWVVSRCTTQLVTVDVLRSSS